MTEAQIPMTKRSGRTAEMTKVQAAMTNGGVGQQRDGE